MIKAINTWSFPGGLENTLPPKEAMALAKQFGYEGIELCIGAEGALSLADDEASCTALRHEADRLGLKLESVASGTYWGRSVGDTDLTARQGAVSDLARMIQITAWLGAKTLLTIPGAVDVFFLPDRAAQPYDEVQKNVLVGLKHVLPAAEKVGVRLGIENVWNKYLLSPLELSGLIDEVGSPSLGAYVDVANILPYGYPEQWLRILSHRVVGVHFKDFRRAVGTAEGFVDLLEGDVNWPEVMVALKDIGYQGPVVAELIPLYKHHPLVRVKNTSNAMDAILGRA